MTTTLTEEWIADHYHGQPCDDGERYQEEGAVTTLFRLKTHLHAQVIGSRFKPYTVKIDLHDLSRQNYSCSCESYRFPCKHVVAVLFHYVREGAVDAGSMLDSLLDQSSHQRLRTFLENLLIAHPAILGALELEAIRSGATKSGSPKNTTRELTGKPATQDLTRAEIPLEFIEKKMKALIQGFMSQTFEVDDWAMSDEEPWEILEKGLSELLEIVEGYLEADNGFLAALFLQKVTDILIRNKQALDEYGESSILLIEQLKIPWVAACLCTSWSPDQKQQIQSVIHGYLKKLGECGLIFDEVLEALQNGWNLPLLKKVQSSGDLPSDGPDYLLAAKRVFLAQGR